MSGVNRADYWACACVKRDRKGNMTHIKLHPPTAKKCRVCKCTKPSRYPEKDATE